MQDFRQAKGGVLIAVASCKYVYSDFSLCQKDFSQSWQVERGIPPVQQFIWPK